MRMTPQTDFINTFFTQIGPNLASKMNEKWQFVGEMSVNMLNDIKTTQAEVYVHSARIMSFFKLMTLQEYEFF